MKMKLLPLMLVAFGLFAGEGFGQDMTVRDMHGWLDFLVKDASLSSVVHRIGKADDERDATKLAPKAQMYIWNSRFQTGASKDENLDLIAVPDTDPNLNQMIVIAILDPVRRRGIYLPWAGRYLDNPFGTYIPKTVMDTFGDY
jgi:hypothetical protein